MNIQNERLLGALCAQKPSEYIERQILKLLEAKVDVNSVNTRTHRFTTDLVQCPIDEESPDTICTVPFDTVRHGRSAFFNVTAFSDSMFEAFLRAGADPETTDRGVSIVHEWDFEARHIKPLVLWGGATSLFSRDYNGHTRIERDIISVELYTRIEQDIISVELKASLREAMSSVLASYNRFIVVHLIAPLAGLAVSYLFDTC